MWTLHFGRTWRKRVSRRRSKRSEECHVDYVNCIFGIFSQFSLLHSCSGLRFLASGASDPEHRDVFSRIYSVLSDVCTPDTCFVMNADTWTMLCREEDVQANDSFRHQFRLHAVFKKIVLKTDCFCICFLPCPGLRRVYS